MAKRKAKANRKSKIHMGQKKLPRQELRGEVREEVPVSNQDVSSGRSNSERGGEVDSTRIREGGVVDSVQHVSTPFTEGTPPWYRSVDSIEDLQECMVWLRDLGNGIDKTMVGVAAYQNEIAFATGPPEVRIWVLPTSMYVLKEVLKNVIVSERSSPAFISRNAQADISRLSERLELSHQEIQILSTNFVHDMTALEYTTGHPIIPRGVNLSIKNDALDAATVGPMMAIDLPSFYTQVAMPLMRYSPDGGQYSTEEREEKSFSRWSIVYEHLLFRMLAHYTQDPTIINWLNDGKNPMKEFATLVELEEQQALAFLLWMCCDEDVSLLVKKYPRESSFMPESPQLIKVTQIDKKIPILRLGFIRLIESFSNTKKSHTLYGRQSPWGASIEELLHFVLFGSISDILDVAMVSLKNLGSDSHYLIVDNASNYPLFSRATIAGWTDRPAIEWQNQLEQIAPLSNPLNQVTLNVKVGVE